MKKISQEIIEEIDSTFDRAIDNLSVNCAIFRFCHGQLEIATVDFMFAELTVLPGGFVYKDEHVEDAVRRLVAYQTGIKDLLIHEVGIFGSANRSFSKEFKILQDAGLPQRLVTWMSQRFISVGYYCTIDDRVVTTNVEDSFFTRLQWLPVSKVDALHLDHKCIATRALDKLALDILTVPILKGLLPEQFTMPTLHALYEAILGRVIDRGNFRQRIIKTKILQKVGLQDKQSQGRPADIYTFNDAVYMSSLAAAQKLGF